MDLNKLTNGEKVIAGSGIALLIFSIFPWFSRSGASHNGWDNFLTALAVLIGIIMVAQVGVRAFTTARLPDLPVSWGQLHLILGVVAFVFVLLQFIIGDKVGALGFSFRLSRSIGIFLGLLASAGLAAGGFLRSQEPEPATGGGSPPPPV